MHPRVWAASSDGLIQYVPLTYNKLGQALEAIRKGFYPNETISIAVGLSKHPEAIRELDGIAIDAARDGVSTVAVEKATGKVAGCLLNKIHIKENQNIEYFDKFTCEHPTSRAFLEANKELDKRTDAFRLLQTECYLETMFTGILPEFRRKGIGRKLQEIALETMQHLKNGNNVKLGIDGNTLPLHPIPTAVLSFPTSSAMKKISEQIGFVYATEIDFNKYEFQDNMVYASVLRKIPPILVMYKHF